MYYHNPGTKFINITTKAFWRFQTDVSSTENTHSPRGGDPFLKGNLSRARGSRIGERDFFLRCVLSLSVSRERCSLSFSLLLRRSPCRSRWWDLLLLRRRSERSFSRWRSRSWWWDRLLLRRRSRDRLRCLLFLAKLWFSLFSITPSTLFR